MRDDVTAWSWAVWFGEKKSRTECVGFISSSSCNFLFSRVSHFLPAPFSPATRKFCFLRVQCLQSTSSVLLCLSLFFLSVNCTFLAPGPFPNHLLLAFKPSPMFTSPFSTPTLLKSPFSRPELGPCSFFFPSERIFKSPVAGGRGRCHVINRVYIAQKKEK